MLAKLNKRMFAFLGVLTILFSLCAMPAMATDTSDWYSESLSPTTNTTQTIGSMDATTGEEYVGPTVDGKDALYSGISDAEAVHDAYIDVMPVVSTNDILKWATTKGNEIIYFLQIIVQPFTIIIFIIAAFITLIGSIGRGDMVGKGLWGMICSVLVYAAVLYAPVILQTFVGWIAS
jgi:hypothetical protein